ncbi:DUF433 domain-containing protein [Reichenbachiella versicolor]|uniref:DUF433 domain-containing protein n=1 Tax=Reichenbachiella versicolor TaxID=1821036 RepID=UPI000D6EACD2|nr:DUF433 domain-containing protein [Reichenbachiella versicolor]
MNNIARYISIDPEVRFGKPCIKGTRIAISDILNWLASGMSEQDILEDYPKLKQEHIRASLSFAAHREQIIKIIAA